MLKISCKHHFVAVFNLRIPHLYLWIQINRLIIKLFQDQKRLGNLGAETDGIPPTAVGNQVRNQIIDDMAVGAAKNPNALRGQVVSINKT